MFIYSKYYWTHLFLCCFICQRFYLCPRLILDIKESDHVSYWLRKQTGTLERLREKKKRQQTNLPSSSSWLLLTKKLDATVSFSRPLFPYMLRIHFCISDLLVCIAFDHIMLWSEGVLNELIYVSFAVVVCCCCSLRFLNRMAVSPCWHWFKSCVRICLGTMTYFQRLNTCSIYPHALEKEYNKSK